MNLKIIRKLVGSRAINHSPKKWYRIKEFSPTAFKRIYTDELNFFQIELLLRDCSYIYREKQTF